MPETEEIYDITIIGGGPVGLFAAFYAGIRKAKTKIIESLPQVGGQLAMLYPEKYIYDIAGYPKIKAGDLIQNLEKQIQPFEQTICLEEEVVHLAKADDLLHIETNRGMHYSKSVIIAAGNGAFQPRRLPVNNNAKFEGSSLFYYVNNMMEFVGKRVAIAGGGDSAIDWALMLESIAKEVSIIHRRPEFRGHEHSVDKLKASAVNILTPFVVEELIEADDKLTGIRLKNVKSKELTTLDLDCLIVNYGFTSSLGHLKDWGLVIERNSIPVSSDMSTSLPGVYAVGDICNYDGKIRLIATGFGEAPTAVNNALHFIRPDQRTQPAHSTSLFANSHA